MKIITAFSLFLAISFYNDIEAFSIARTKCALPVKVTERQSLSRCWLSSSQEQKEAAPPSKIESIVGNAKDLLPNVSTSKEKKSELIKAAAAGLAVALAVIPEAVAFSFVAGVNPLTGLWTTVMLGFTAASLGGRAGIISSCSGACSVVVAALCASHGSSYLAATAVLAGLMQIVAGILRLGKFIRLVPHPVMLGFVNGLALIMTKAQLVHFTNGGKFVSIASKAGASLYGIAAATMVFVKLIPKLTKAIPPSLAAVIMSTILARVLNLPVKTLSDVAGAATFKGGMSVLPKMGFPTVPFSFDTLKIIFPYALIMSSVGIIESLLTMQLLDGMADDGKRGSTIKECIGQGAGNMLSGLTGGIGGCALLGQSIVNMQSGGGISRFSGMSMGIFLAAGIVAFAPLIGSVPVASLAGVMLLVCQSTFSWSSLRVLRKIPRLDALIIALVSFLTVQKDLAFAVLCGTIASSLGFAWKQSTSLTASTSAANEEKVYKLTGPLFFGSCTQFQSIFSPKADSDKVIIDFADSRVMDHSALEAINNLAGQYGDEGKTVFLCGLSSDCAQLLKKIHFSKDGEADLPSYEVIEPDPSSDPVYGVAEDASLYEDIAIPET